MAIDTPEKRRSALDFGKRCGDGMPVPFGSIPETSRAHILGLYVGVLPPSTPSYYWSNRNLLSTTWEPKVNPSDSSTVII